MPRRPRQQQALRRAARRRGASVGGGAACRRGMACSHRPSTHHVELSQASPHTYLDDTGGLLLACAGVGSVQHAARRLLGQPPLHPFGDALCLGHLWHGRRRRACSCHCRCRRRRCAASLPLLVTLRRTLLALPPLLLPLLAAEAPRGSWRQWRGNGILHLCLCACITAAGRLAGGSGDAAAAAGRTAAAAAWCSRHSGRRDARQRQCWRRGCCGRRRGTGALLLLWQPTGGLCPASAAPAQSQGCKVFC